MSEPKITRRVLLHGDEARAWELGHRDEMRARIIADGPGLVAVWTARGLQTILVPEADAAGLTLGEAARLRASAERLGPPS